MADPDIAVFGPEEKGRSASSSSDDSLEAFERRLEGRLRLALVEHEAARAEAATVRAAANDAQAAANAAFLHAAERGDAVADAIKEAGRLWSSHPAILIPWLVRHGVNLRRYRSALEAALGRPNMRDATFQRLFGPYLAAQARRESGA